MKKRYHILQAHVTGRKIPVTSLVTVWLLADRLNAPQWLWGIYWFIVLILVINLIYDCLTVKEIGVDIQKLLEEKGEVKIKSFSDLTKK